MARVKLLVAVPQDCIDEVFGGVGQDYEAWQAIADIAKEAKIQSERDEADRSARRAKTVFKDLVPDCEFKVECEWYTVNFRGEVCGDQKLKTIVNDNGEVFVELEWSVEATLDREQYADLGMCAAAEFVRFTTKPVLTQGKLFAFVEANPLFDMDPKAAPKKQKLAFELADDDDKTPKAPSGEPFDHIEINGEVVDRKKPKRTKKQSSKKSSPAPASA